MSFRGNIDRFIELHEALNGHVRVGQQRDFFFDLYKMTLPSIIGYFCLLQGLQIKLNFQCLHCWLLVQAQMSRDSNLFIYIYIYIYLSCLAETTTTTTIA